MHFCKKCSTVGCSVPPKTGERNDFEPALDNLPLASVATRRGSEHQGCICVSRATGVGCSCSALVGASLCDVRRPVGPRSIRYEHGGGHGERAGNLDREPLRSLWRTHACSLPPKPPLLVWAKHSGPSAGARWLPDRRLVSMRPNDNGARHGFERRGALETHNIYLGPIDDEAEPVQGAAVRATRL